MSLSPALAHNGEHHEGIQPGEKHAHHAPHGGLIRTVGHHHLELVVAPDSLTVYVLDNKMNVEPASGTGKAILQVPGKGKQTVALSAMNDHLMGSASLKDVASFVAVVTVPVEGKPQSTRFVYKK